MRVPECPTSADAEERTGTPPRVACGGLHEDCSVRRQASASPIRASRDLNAQNQQKNPRTVSQWPPQQKNNVGTQPTIYSGHPQNISTAPEIAQAKLNPAPDPHNCFSQADHFPPLSRSRAPPNK